MPARPEFLWQAALRPSAVSDPESSHASSPTDSPPRTNNLHMAFEDADLVANHQ